MKITSPSNNTITKNVLLFALTQALSTTLGSAFFDSKIFFRNWIRRLKFRRWHSRLSRFPVHKLSSTAMPSERKWRSTNGKITKKKKNLISQSYLDPYNVRNCYLVGLTDLDGSQSYVQDVQAGYLNDLIDIGVAGKNGQILDQEGKYFPCQ